MPADYGLNLIFDPEDALKHQELLAGLHGLDEGRLVCEAPPDSRRFIALADQAFEAMGKDIDSEGSGRSSAASWRLLLVWLLGEDVDHLFVNRAHLLDRREWESLFALAAAAGVQLWLIAQAHPLRRGLREAALDWPLQEFEFEEFVARWEERGDPSSDQGSEQALVDETDAGFPAVPEADFPTFRAACSELLAPSDFAVVDRAYIRAFNAATAWRDGEAETMLRSLARHLDESRSGDEAIVGLRAAQAALLRRGWFLRVDPAKVELVKAEAQTRNIDHAALAKLRRYVHPARAGAAVLAMVSGWSPSQLAALKIGDLGLDGRARVVRLKGESWTLPSGATPPVRALMAQRRFDGGGAEDSLFVTGRGERLRPITTAALRWWLRRMTHETGLSLARSWNVDATEDIRWRARKMGIGLVRL